MNTINIRHGRAFTFWALGNGGEKKNVSDVYNEYNISYRRVSLRACRERKLLLGKHFFFFFEKPRTNRIKQSIQFAIGIRDTSKTVGEPRGDVFRNIPHYLQVDKYFNCILPLDPLLRWTLLCDEWQIERVYCKTIALNF